MKNPANIIFFGAPGAGKGTQAKKVSEKLGLPHIDTGNLIREAIANKTELGIKAKNFVESGKLVPDELVIDLIRERLVSLKDKKDFKGFILDGYPRTEVQADELQIMLAELSLSLTDIFNIKVPDEILTKRLSSRRLCTNKSCSAIYNIISQKPKIENKCDLCGQALYQRKDDTEDAAKQRLKEYYDKTAPLEKYYTKGSIKDIDGTKESDKVTEEILKEISESEIEFERLKQNLNFSN